MSHLSTDILIIGSGGAGLRAALEAVTVGVHVIVVTKSKIGRATCTAVAMGAFRASRGKREHHFRETLEAGRFLNNPYLVKLVVDDAWDAVKELELLGVHLSFEGDRVSITGRKPAGIFLARSLSAALHERVSVLERTCVIRLLVEQGRCSGALAIKRDTGESVIISAKAVILATGGYSQLYERNDNPHTITGDGLILAYNAGAELQDLEFVQFQLMFTDSGVPRMPILDWLIEATKNCVAGGPLINKEGEPFLGSYGLLQQKISRDTLIVAVEREILEEKSDNSVILDLTSCSSDEIEGALYSGFQKSAIHPFLKLLSTRQLHVASCAHYTVGGVTIDGSCRTSVKGLYAVGEVTGGIHGANRLGGNALTEILVFGKIAGQCAAEYSNQVDTCELDREHIRETEQYIRELRKAKKESVSPLIIKKEVKSVMSLFCRPVRSGDGLRSALDMLHHIEAKAAFMNAEKVTQLEAACEAQFMLVLARLVVTAALERKESRGSHFRIDYPESNDEWLKNIVITQENGKPRIRYAPVPRLK